MNLPYTIDGDAVRLSVRVTPRAAKDAVAGVVDTGDGRSAPAVRLNAQPVDGAANRALVAYLARVLGVPRKALSIASGETSRLKIVQIRGVDAAALESLIVQGSRVSS